MELMLATMIAEKSILLRTALKCVVKLVDNFGAYASRLLRSRMQSVQKPVRFSYSTVVMQSFDTKTKKKEILYKNLIDPTKKWINIGKVHAICMYPIMSGIKMIIPECYLDYDGIARTGGDFALRNNMFVIYDQETKHIQRHKFDIDLRSLNLEMLKLKFRNLEVLKEMTVIFKDAETVSFKLEIETVRKLSRIVECTSFCNEFSVKVECYDCGEKAAQWISSYLRKPNLRLGYIITKPAKSKTFWQTLYNLYTRRVDGRNITISYLTNLTCTLMSLFNNSNKSIEYPSGYDNFQHNIIISINHDCFTEMEKWEWIKIGNAIFKNTRLWMRSTDINMKDTPEELKMKFMLIHGELYQSGKVELDDNVYIIKYQ